MLRGMKSGRVLLLASACAGFAARASNDGGRHFAEKVKPLPSA
jgi:hypothetical protein